MTTRNFAEFQKLCDKRDCLAYQAAGAVKTAIVLLELGEGKAALNVLKLARADFDLADFAISEFLNSKKENQSDGNQPTAA